MGNNVVCNQCEQPLLENKNYSILSTKTQLGSQRGKILTKQVNQHKNWEGNAIKFIKVNQYVNEIVYPDGSYYKGQTLNRMRHGKGIQHLDGIQYEGMWWQDKAHGRGALKAKNLVFQGLFQANQIVKGKMKVFKGKITQIYQGQFKDFKYNGKGVLKTIGQSRYEEEFKNHKKQGQGKIAYENGSIYEGEFKNGLMCGYGTYRSMQFEYNGEFVDNKMNGKGICKKNKQFFENEILFQNRVSESQKVYLQEQNKDTNNFTFAKPKLRA